MPESGLIPFEHILNRDSESAAGSGPEFGIGRWGGPHASARPLSDIAVPESAKLLLIEPKRTGAVRDLNDVGGTCDTASEESRIGTIRCGSSRPCNRRDGRKAFGPEIGASLVLDLHRTSMDAGNQ